MEKLEQSTLLKCLLHFFDTYVHPIEYHPAVCTFFTLTASMKLLTFPLTFQCRSNHYIPLKAMDIVLLLLAAFLKRLLIFVYFLKIVARNAETTMQIWYNFATTLSRGLFNSPIK